MDNQILSRGGLMVISMVFLRELPADTAGFFSLAMGMYGKIDIFSQQWAEFEFEFFVTQNLW